MTETERKALALMNEVRAEAGRPPNTLYAAENMYAFGWVALCRAIEQHEAFRQEVSDALSKYDEMPPEFHRFIIAKPEDPLVEAIRDTGLFTGYAEELAAAIEKRGGKIVWGAG